MFDDDSIAGSWTALVDRLNSTSTIPLWAEGEPALAGLQDVEGVVERLSKDACGERRDEVVGALIRLTTADRSPDDALLLLLHSFSGLVLSLAHDLRDLHDDIVPMVVGELTCQIRMFTQRGRSRAFAANLRLETRRALLHELRPCVRNHPELGEQVTDTGQLPPVLIGGGVWDSDDAIDLADLLKWSINSGVDAGEVTLLIATERARAATARDRHAARSSDRSVALANGLCERTLYRRRNRTLTRLRLAAAEYLGAAA